MAGLDFGVLFSPNMLSMIGLIVTLFSFVLVAGGLIFLMFWLATYNVKIYYIDKRNNVNRLMTTTGKYVVEDGVPKLKIWKAKNKMFKIPGNLQVFSKGKRDVIYMTRDVDGNWNFMEFDFTNPQSKKLSEVPPEARLWESLQYRKNFERFHKQTFWDKYGSIIVQYGFIVIVVVLLIVLFTKFNIVANGLKDAAAALSQCQHL